MASRWKKPSIVSKYLKARARNRSSSSGQLGGPAQKRSRRTEGFQVRVEVPCGSQVDLEDQAGTGLRWENGEEDELSQGPECWGDDEGDEAQVQSHRRKKRSCSSIRLREQEAWEQLRFPFTQCFTSSLTMPPGQFCMCCPRPAEFRCRDCSAIAYYCEDCCRSQHRWCNILHVLEKWVSDHYSFAPLHGLVIPITHECPSTYRKHITVVSLRGNR